MFYLVLMRPAVLLCVNYHLWFQQQVRKQNKKRATAARAEESPNKKRVCSMDNTNYYDKQEGFNPQPLQMYQIPTPLQRHKYLVGDTLFHQQMLGGDT